MQKSFEPPTLVFAPRSVYIGENVPKVDQTEGWPEGKVKTMRISQLVAEEKLDTELLQKMKNTKPPRRKNDKTEPSTGTPHGKRWVQKKIGVMKGKTLQPAEGSRVDPASPPPQMIYNTMSNTLPTGYSSRPQLVANVDRK